MSHLFGLHLNFIIVFGCIAGGLIMYPGETFVIIAVCFFKLLLFLILFETEVLDTLH